MIWSSVSCRIFQRRQDPGASQHPPSPTVEWLLAHRQTKPTFSQELTPLGSLYRMYECIVYANTIGLRNEIEFFFIRSTWKVSEIPDPADPDPQRYAILSVIPHLLVRAFNRLIEKGLPRDAPAIVMGDDHFDELASRPKILETVPAWCVSVPEIDQTLVIPSEDGSIPVRETASDEFKKKNVIVFEPHILFV